mmetsp:Transcript_17191/g.19549  ORF Transcript_17191/g.19549 Transcript_17191/m.19549 type:complete len:554 (-) Transcript_17191:656-2317(-)
MGSSQEPDSLDSDGTRYGSGKTKVAEQRPEQDQDTNLQKGEKMKYSQNFKVSSIELLADVRVDDDRARYIPLRLTEAERALLHVVDGALEVCEYTDRVDVSSNNYFARQAVDKHETVMEELKDLFQIILGVGICNDYKTTGAKLLFEKSLRDNRHYLRRCAEIGRRYKIMNPDKMRSNYGKLLYALMDVANPRIRRQIGFDLKIELKSVHSFLRDRDALDLLADSLLPKATMPLDDSLDSAGLRAQSEVRAAAIDELVLKYGSNSSENKVESASSNESSDAEENTRLALSEDDVRLVLNSISDNFSFLSSNRGPVVKMISYLKRFFNPNVVPKSSLESLEIRYGKGGSKLSHSHETQFYFVLQSLTLWKEILGNFFKLWVFAEEDLLDERNGYRLVNTGQGLQRCQAAPRVSKAMANNLAKTKSQVGKWVGLSVVHLGDRDVPNALVFIDKYTQVARILSPLVNVLEKIDDLAEDPQLAHYIQKNFSDISSLRKLILADYFKHGFDGSGDDGGSCIDGRLTSNWNWCSKLEKKKYYPIFLFAGFQGFDGDFRE